MKTFLNKYVDEFWCERTTWDGPFQWRKHYYGLWTRVWPEQYYLLQTHSFSLHRVLFGGLDSCGLLWCFYQLFGLSFWRHPFTAEDPLVSKWWNGKVLQICSYKETISTHQSYNLHLPDNKNSKIKSDLGWATNQNTLPISYPLGSIIAGIAQLYFLQKI